jgi:serine/threonine-protein kinase HipA
MKCLLCYKPLNKVEKNYHSKCVSKTFGLKQMPLIDFDESQLSSYAKKIVGAHHAITGVQPKLSLWLEKDKQTIRFTIIDGQSNYIIKPQTEKYIALPENEDLCMHLATEFGITTAKHGLVKLPSGKLAYITQRFDRTPKSKLACEDLCQLSETLTEHKYRTSYEQTGKIIKIYSSQSGLDALYYFQLVVFSFITANADMHLKNFSMLENEDNQFTLSPAYDLVSTALVIKNETEQMALAVNGRRNKITKNDFIALANNLQLNPKQQQTVFANFLNKQSTALWFIKNSFLPTQHKNKLTQILTERIQLLCA